MERIRVSSSNIKSIGYYEVDSILEIEFISGGIYQYFSVPKSVFEALMSARSHGSYFHAYVRDRYPTKKIR
jgi:hypothetical protein